jgi:hypothetical protein
MAFTFPLLGDPTMLLWGKEKAKSKKSVIEETKKNIPLIGGGISSYEKTWGCTNYNFSFSIFIFVLYGFLWIGKKFRYSKKFLKKNR